MLSLDDIETRYCQFVDEVINYHRLDRLSAYLTPDVIEHAPARRLAWPVPTSSWSATSPRFPTST